MSNPKKGEKGGECNHSTCIKSDSHWYNYLTKAYYCRECVVKSAYDEQVKVITKQMQDLIQLYGKMYTESVDTFLQNLSLHSFTEYFRKPKE